VPVGFKWNWIESLWGRTQNDLWGVGSATNDTSYIGVIMHFNGTSWKYIFSTQFKIMFSDIRQQVNSGKYFLEGVVSQSGGDIYKLFSFDKKFQYSLMQALHSYSLE
jgi:hypothetical protein